jgi:16S rRNA processing protein RimM
LTSPDRTDSLLEIGVVVKPHGVHGRIRILLYNAESDSIFQLSRILLKTDDEITECEIAEIHPGPRGPLLLLAGTTDREQADRLRGAKVMVRREDLLKLEPDEFYVADLVGLDVFDGSKRLGRITSSRKQAEVEIATISTDGGEQLDLPLVEDYVVNIDFTLRRVLARCSDLLPRSKKELPERLK